MNARRVGPWLVGLVLGACAQTGVVARELIANGQEGGDATPRDAQADDADARCDGGACSAEPRRPASACSALSSHDALCASRSAAARAGDSCSADDVSPSFRYALCSCSDLISARALMVDAFDGALANKIAGAAAVGVNGSMTLAQPATVDEVLRVVGKVMGPSTLNVEVVSSAPCACAADRQLDVRANVLARKRDNDNATVGLLATALDNPASDPQLDLPCGRYFFTRHRWRTSGHHPHARQRRAFRRRQHRAR